MRERKIVITSLDDEIDALARKTNHKRLGTWAADCAERVLPLFEAKFPNDQRPRQAIATLRTWVKTGVFKMSVIRGASLSSHASAREAEALNEKAAKSAARAAGQAVATAHVPTHSIAAGRYAASAIWDSTNSMEAVENERSWQLAHLEKLASA